MRINALILLLSIAFQSISAMDKGETAWYDTLPEWQKKLMEKGLWYSRTPHGYEPLDPEIFLLPFLKELKIKGTQEQKDAELRSCMHSAQLEWPIKRLLIAGCVFAGADQNIPDENVNPLIKACREQDFGLVQFLCDRGANIAIADGCHYQRMILFEVNKHAIAVYLAQRGAELNRRTSGGGNLLHNPSVCKARGSARLVQLYLDNGVDIAIDRMNILHQLAKFSASYDRDAIPKLLKKFNMIITHIGAEKSLQLLQQRDNTFKLLPEEKCMQSGFAYSEASQILAGIMRQRREMLEQFFASK